MTAQEYLIKISATRFDKEYNKKIAVKDTNGALEMLMRQNAVRQHAALQAGLVGTPEYESKIKEYNEKIRKGNLHTNELDNDYLKDLNAKNKQIDKMYRDVNSNGAIKLNKSKSRYGTPINDKVTSLNLNEAKTNYFQHGGPYYQMDHLFNRNNKHIYNTFAGTGEGFGDIGPDEGFYIHHIDKSKNPNNETIDGTKAYAKRSIRFFGDLKGVLKGSYNHGDLMMENDFNHFVPNSKKAIGYRVGHYPTFVRNIQDGLKNGTTLLSKIK